MCHEQFLGLMKMGFSIKKKESPPILFRVLLVTQNHAPKLRFLGLNLKASFLVHGKNMRDSKVREYGYM